jgi:hypothetical protein
LRHRKRRVSRYYQDVRTSASISAGSVAAAAIIAATAAACGSQTPTSPAPGGHTVIAMVMLESTGPNPREIAIGVGEFVSS